MSHPQDLRVIQVFSDLDDTQLNWLAGCAQFVTLKPGEALFHEGDPANVMFSVLEGEFRSKREKGAPDGRLFVRKTGQIGGMLPFSRITHFPVTGRAVLPTRLACFSSDLFPEMTQRIPVLEARLASTMADRVREAAQYDQQREKLMSLGKLSAGLAHELNNPAAAIQRSTEELGQRLQDLSGVTRSLLDQTATPARLQALIDLREDMKASPSTASDLLDRSNAEEELTEWLEAHDVPKAWLAAETFLVSRITVPHLEDAIRDLPEAVLQPALQWLEADLASRQLLNDIIEASRRIADLNAAVKSYSHMDRAPTMSEIDIHEGIQTTLTILAHKLRSKDVVLKRAFDPKLPRVNGNPGELNQVWTNLIDNAIDAVPVGGEITIRTSGTEVEVLVQVIDNGAGIPSEIRWRIFEPFFTTKDVGQGTGLGLDVVQRIVQAHQANVRVDSSPGHTCFEVRLPVYHHESGSKPS